MVTLCFLLLIPFIWPIISKILWGREITVFEMFSHIVLMSLIIGAGFYIGKYSKEHDTEILNGEITKKQIVDSSYTVTYKCGKSTCTSHHYTREWAFLSTVGKIRIKYEDWTSPAVYLIPSPALYTNAKIGDPASLEHSYTNYVKAVPDSLFNGVMNTKDVPDYPQIYDRYKFNRIVADSNTWSTVELNDALNIKLKELGPKKKVNIIVFLTRKDPDFANHVENYWVGGKQNDVLVFIGIDKDTNNIVWTDAKTWAKNYKNADLAVDLATDLKNLNTQVYDTKNLVATIGNAIDTEYNHPDMKDFQYLENEVEPPLWGIIVLTFLSVFGTLLLSIYFYENDFAEDLATVMETLNNA